MRFTVTITRTSVASKDIEIDDATIVTSKQAVRKALDEAGDEDFTSCVVEYQFGCDGVSPDDGTWDDADQDPDDFDDDGDPSEQMMRAAEAMASGTGEELFPNRTDEPLPGSSDIADAKAHEIDGHDDEKFAICDASIMPDDLNAAIDAGWLPSYFIGDEEQSGPVCPRCDEQFLVRDEGGESVLHVEGEFVSVWDGGTEVVSPCTVDPRTREVRIRYSEDRLALQSLDREYVRLNGKEYATCHEDDWRDYIAEEQSRTFWWR